MSAGRQEGPDKKTSTARQLFNARTLGQVLVLKVLEAKGKGAAIPKLLRDAHDGAMATLSTNNCDPCAVFVTPVAVGLQS